MGPVNTALSGDVRAVATALPILLSRGVQLRISARAGMGYTLGTNRGSSSKYYSRPTTRATSLGVALHMMLCLPCFNVAPVSSACRSIEISEYRVAT